MFKNYLLVAIRNLSKQKQYIIVNVAGLAIGIAVCLLIVGFVSNDLQFEHCHKNLSRIYRVDGAYQLRGSGVSMASIMPAVGPAMAESFPEIEKEVRIRRLWDVKVEFAFDDVITENKVFAAEPQLLDIFTLPLKQGNPETALTAPMTVIISEEVAANHFAGQNPVGSFIKLKDEYDFQITGVMKEIPANTQIRGNFIISYASLEKMGEDVKSWTEIFQDYTYLLLHKNAAPTLIENKIPEFLESHIGADEAKNYELRLQPLSEIYFHSDLSYELPPDGDLTLIYVFTGIALLILLIACINFINLSTARTAPRMKEVGVRKVLGAKRGQLIRQFLSESILLTCIAMLIGIAMYEIVLPHLESFMDRELAVRIYNDPILILTILGMILFVGVFSGSYPAFVLSRFRPSSILRGEWANRSAKSYLRRALVIFQFAIAIILICLTFAVYDQINYSVTKDLGFNKDNILLIDVEKVDSADKRQLIENAIENSGPVKISTLISAAPGENRHNLFTVNPENKLDEDPTLMHILITDYDFLSTFGIKLIAGRELLADRNDKSNHSILINETAVREFEIENPIGFKFYHGETAFEVVGVVKDFNFNSLHNEIQPCMIMAGMNSRRLIAARLAGKPSAGAIAEITAAWNEIMPDMNLDYSFLDDVILKNYESEKKVGTLLTVFSFVAVFIACLGLFGLASFTTEQRTKEIGIRKVLGASISSIIRLVSKEYLILVIIANLAAWPIAFLAAEKWQQDFAYRPPISWESFIIAGGLALVIALATVSFQSLKAARSNPVNTLRNE
jgi:putative ABC transport system permease protein